MGLKQKLGMSVMSAALGLSLIGGGTYAYFSDTVTAEASYTTGELELNIDDSTATSFNFENMKPGEEKEIDFTLKNDGSLDINTLLLGITNSNPGLAPYLKVKEFKLGSEDTLGSLEKVGKISDKNDNGYIDLADLAGYSNIDLPGAFSLAAPSKGVHFTIEFVDTGEAQNSLQGVANTLTINFEGRQ